MNLILNDKFWFIIVGVITWENRIKLYVCMIEIF